MQERIPYPPAITSQQRDTKRRKHEACAKLMYLSLILPGKHIRSKTSAIIEANNIQHETHSFLNCDNIIASGKLFVNPSYSDRLHTLQTCQSFKPCKIPFIHNTQHYKQCTKQHRKRNTSNQATIYKTSRQYRADYRQKTQKNSPH